MAVLNQLSDDFVISPAADRLLSSVSDDFADTILKFASLVAETYEDGTKVVTTDDVKQVIAQLCDGLEAALKSGQAPAGIQKHVEFLRAFCDNIRSERTGK